MNISKVILFGLLFFSLFVFSGCEGSNSESPIVDEAATTSAKYSGYALSAVANGSLNITESGQSIVIDLYVADSTLKKPIADENVSVEYFDPSKGTMNSYNGITDTNGHFAFTYTAPPNLSNLLNNTITFKLDNDTTKLATTTITFNSSIQVDTKYQNYVLNAIPDGTITITKASQAEVIDLYVSDKSTHKPIVNEIVNLSYFDGSKGSMNQFSGTTDVNGHVAFSYLSPNTISSMLDFNMTFTLDGDISKTDIVRFIVSPSVTNLPTIRVENSSITLTTNNENMSVKVLAFNTNNEPFNSGTIVVRYPTQIINGGVSGGHFTQSEVAISNGAATFNFVGPNPLTSIESMNFTFVYKENTSVSTTLTVNYVPAIPKIVLNNSNITITKNGETVTVGMSVYNADNSPYPDGNIKIKYPSEILNGKNVGSFDFSSVAVANGKASFKYTAPNPLDGNDTIVFTFYHDVQPILSATDLNISIVPEANQVVLNNYVLNALYETTMGLNITKQMTFFVIDDKGVKVTDTNVVSMVVTLLNPILGTLEDSSGATGTSLTLNNKNNVQMNVRTNTLSGILPIRVTTTFKDANNNTQILTQVFNIVVLSGPPTAMSLSYVSTQQDATRAKFIENWVLTVTDKYNNLVNTTPAVSMGMITGYAQSSSLTTNQANYLYYDSAINDGNLTNNTIDTFTSSQAVFGNIDLVNDKLVLFGGTGYIFDTYGKWDIDTVDTTNRILSLKDNYNGTNVSGLGYAVGHNFRNETCSGTPAVANVYAEGGNNILDATGSIIVQVEYDYYLVGKSTVLWTNLIGESNNTQAKVGLGRQVTLRGLGLNGDSYSFPAGTTGVKRLNLHISNTPEFYTNANFGFDFEISGDGNGATLIGTSMNNNITSCLNNGVAYVDINITASASSGTLKLTNILPANEF